MIFKKNSRMQSRKAQISMSVGTIVTIVLLMTTLILGLVLVRNIFGTATKVIDLSDAQLTEEVNKLFGEDKGVVVYPATRRIEIKQEEINGFGIGIQNLIGTGNDTFSYEVIVSDLDVQQKCGINGDEISRWIVTGRAENNIPIVSGSKSTQRVLLDIPAGSPLCTFRLRVNVNSNKGTYGTEFMDIIIKPR
ncbi:MAG TPA: hypothetical protein VJ208_03450 [Candidatus Nanoarchaeia archaeon]|nr:hypothetical protein [Candidatus Nanoarchaeia archaeon]